LQAIDDGTMRSSETTNPLSRRADLVTGVDRSIGRAVAVDTDVLAKELACALEAIAAAAPMHRLAEPGEIASSVTFLASLTSGWVNGEVILANNGGTI
jgi:NAD(P)-dependent dehydrogenase (short-subunit alcohol dehydrogenase family)